jgi:uncharacterized protein
MMAPKVKCPTCGRSIEWSAASPFRPFCSERCKLIDLGAWLAEQRSIADDAAPESSPGEPTGPTGSGEV